MYQRRFIEIPDGHFLLPYNSIGFFFIFFPYVCMWNVYVCVCIWCVYVCIHLHLCVLCVLLYVHMYIQYVCLCTWRFWVDVGALPQSLHIILWGRIFQSYSELPVMAGLTIQLASRIRCPCPLRLELQAGHHGQSSLPWVPGIWPLVLLLVQLWLLNHLPSAP